MQLLRDYLTGNARVAFLACLIYKFGVAFRPVNGETFHVDCESTGQSFLIPVSQFYAAVSLAYSDGFSC